MSWEHITLKMKRKENNDVNSSCTLLGQQIRTWQQIPQLTTPGQEHWDPWIISPYSTWMGKTDFHVLISPGHMSLLKFSTSLHPKDVHSSSLRCFNSFLWVIVCFWCYLWDSSVFLGHASEWIPLSVKFWKFDSLGFFFFWVLFWRIPGTVFRDHYWLGSGDHVWWCWETKSGKTHTNQELLHWCCRNLPPLHIQESVAKLVLVSIILLKVIESEYLPMMALISFIHW